MTAPESPALPPSRSLRLARPGRVELGALTAAERAKLGRVGQMQRVGVHRSLPDGSTAKGSWTTLSSGRTIWRVDISSGQAVGIRVEFSNFAVGTGKVWVHSGTSMDGPYTDRGPYGNGEFWSGTVAGDSATIEYEAASGAPSSGAPPFHVHRVSHQVANADPAPLADGAATCNLDVNCYADWQDTKRSVAQIRFEETEGSEQGTFLCSGSLVGTRDNSFTPYLMTAGHCIHDEAAARSLETFWAYESSGCNLGPPVDRGTLNSHPGGHLLAWGTIESGDYSLVLLQDVPSGVVFAGWDVADPDVGSPVVGIHHPLGSYKRIAFGHTVTSEGVSIGQDPAPAPLYHDVAWDSGITGPGSSGSPLFSAPGVIVGMLTYGPDLPGEELCLIGDAAGYGKFSNAYPNLQAYLEDLPFSQVQPSSTNVQFTGRNRAIQESATQSLTLTVDAAAPVAWGARADAPWVTISQSSGTVSASEPATLRITVDSKYFIASDTYTSTVTILSGAAPPQFINVQVHMTIDTSNVVVSATPNPVPKSGSIWQLTIQVQETAGVATTLTTLKIDGVDYSKSIPAFFGSASLDANGMLSGTLHTFGLITPVTKYFELYGQDAGSGQTWYHLLPVTFTP